MGPVRGRGFERRGGGARHSLLRLGPLPLSSSCSRTSTGSEPSTSGDEGLRGDMALLQVCVGARVCVRV